MLRMCYYGRNDYKGANMTARPTVSETVQRWQQGTQQAQGRYATGIQTSGDWAAASLAAAPARNAGLQQAIASGAIDRGIQALGTAQWRIITMAKGPTNWLTGVANAGSQYAQGVQTLYGYLDTADNAISSMPRGGYAENRARMNAYIDSVHNSAQARKGY